LSKSDDVKVLSYSEEKNEKSYQKIINFGMTNPHADVIEIEDEETGKKIKCTPEHKIMTINRGWVEAKNITENDEIIF
jgi:intein/homing endonuclease